MNVITRHWSIARSAFEEDRNRVCSKAAYPDFLPAALEIIEQPVSPTARKTGWLLFGGLALALVWSILGKVDIVASAPGKLIPLDNIKLVQTAEAGIVRHILVQDGQRVRKGQVLVDLDPTVSGAESTQARRALLTAQLDAARAQAILSAIDGHGLKFIAPPSTPPELSRIQRDLAASELERLLASHSAKVSGASAAAAAREEAQVQATKLTETLPLLDQQLAAYESLLSQGYASRLKVIELRRQRLAAVGDRDAALASARRTDAQFHQADSDQAQNRLSARVQVLESLTKAKAEVVERREELIKSEKRSSLQRLISPVDGTIAQLDVHTIGGVVESGKALMAVVPADGKLVAEVKVLNRDIGFMRPGQPVALKLDAFPFTQYGTVAGTVQSMSTDAVEDEKLGLVYIARVLPSARNKPNLSLSAGMSVIADIRTGERSIMSYLLSPISAAALEAGRER